MKKKLSLILLLALIVSGGYWAYQKYDKEVRQLQELAFEEALESTSPDNYLEAIKENYPQFSSYLITQASDNQPTSYAIPGLAKSKNIHAKGKKLGKLGWAKDMTPQGLTIAEDFIVVSAYSKSKSYYSVLWLINKSDGKFVKTIVLPNTDHVGGLAYDTDHQKLWLTTVVDDWSDSTIAYLDYQDLLNYQFDQSKETISLHQDFDLTGIKRSSFMTYAEQKLWVGYFDKDDAGHLSYYDLDENGLPLANTTSDDLEDSKAIKTAKIPEKIQGVTFYKDKVIFSQSYGDSDAHLLVYSNPGLENLTDFTNENILETIDAPSYLEQTWAQDDRLYTLFESYASSYRDNPFVVEVDRILTLQLP